MSARKLGRIAGLVFVLAAVFGGVGVGVRSQSGTHEAGGSPTTLAVEMRSFEVVWA